VAVEPLDALEAEAARTGAFLLGVGAPDWELATRCPPMTFRDLAAHTLRGALRLSELLGAPLEGEAERDSVTYWDFDADAEGPKIVERARAAAAAWPGTSVAGEWSQALKGAIAAARRSLDANPLLGSPVGTIRLRDYVPTRCIEMTVHSMDLRDALGLEPDPTPQALGVTCDVLRGILGADLRPQGFEEVRFALLGTGRSSLTDAEAATLGPLAASFPLLR
jgi:uncharacterized protein (TIGR03083 family)